MNHLFVAGNFQRVIRKKRKKETQHLYKKNKLYKYSFSFEQVGSIIGITHCLLRACEKKLPILSDENVDSFSSIILNYFKTCISI